MMTKDDTLYAMVPNEDVIESLSANIATHYQREIEFGSAMSVAASVRSAIFMSTYTRAIYLGGRKFSSSSKLVCVFGVCPDPGQPRIGVPWYLGTTFERNCGRHILAHAREYLALCTASGRYAELINYVFAENVNSIRFIEWLGFHVEPPEPWGAYGKPFRRFRMTRYSGGQGIV